MKKILLILIIGLSLNIHSKATLTIIDRGTLNVVTPGTVMHVWGDINNNLMTSHEIAVINNTGTTTKINMSRYTLSAQNTVEDYFCWYVCLGSVVSNTNNGLYHSQGACFNSNDTDTLNYFGAYYKPMGLTGTATYRYVWYDVNNSDDSTYMDITFHVTPVSVNELNKNVSLQIYPNPANEVVNLNLENIDFNSNVTAEIYDLIGNKVMTQVITSTNSRLDVSEFSNGAYFCTIVSDKKSILTKRIIISH